MCLWIVSVDCVCGLCLLIVSVNCVGRSLAILPEIQYISMLSAPVAQVDRATVS
jgi:hypothetical protein